MMLTFPNGQKVVFNRQGLIVIWSQTLPWSWQLLLSKYVLSLSFLGFEPGAQTLAISEASSGLFATTSELQCDSACSGKAEGSAFECQKGCTQQVLPFDWRSSWGFDEKYVV